MSVFFLPLPVGLLNIPVTSSCHTNILTIYDMIKLRTSEYVYRNCNRHIFERLHHQHNTRGREGLIVPVHSLETFKRSLTYSGPKTWKKVIIQLRNRTYIICP